jgi:hypothetical protein
MIKTINLKKGPCGCRQSQLISVKINDVEKVRMTVTATGCIIVHAAGSIFFRERLVETIEKSMLPPSSSFRSRTQAIDCEYHYKIEFKKPTTSE